VARRAVQLASDRTRYGAAAVVPLERMRIEATSRKCSEAYAHRQP